GHAGAARSCAHRAQLADDHPPARATRSPSARPTARAVPAHRRRRARRARRARELGRVEPSARRAALRCRSRPAHSRTDHSHTYRRDRSRMSAIRPNKDQFIELMNAPDDGPVVMLNLLKFKPRGGQGEYNKYGDSVSKMVEERGGKMLWVGKVDQTLI